LYLTPRIILKEQVEGKFEDIFSEIFSEKDLRFFRIEKPEKKNIKQLKFFLETWGESRVLVLSINNYPPSTPRTL
jgi:predicted nucleic acid-binding protein